jgi:hypothetical protein
MVEEKRFSKTTTIKPTRIIEKGLGFSFDTSIEDVKKLNFLSLETKKNGKPKYVGQWFKFVMDKDGFWNQKKITIRSRKKDSIVSSFGAEKYYRGDASESVESECTDDFYLISNSLKEKYPKLVEVRRVEGVHFLPHNVKGRTNLVLAEGRRETLVYIEGAYSINMSLGRSVSLECKPYGRKSARKSAYNLELLYREDSEISLPKLSESDKRLIRDNQLKDRKINIKEL